MFKIETDQHRYIEKPWGNEVIFVERPEYTSKCITIKPGCKCSLQLHAQKIETITVIKGQMLLHIAEKKGDPIYTQLFTQDDSFTIKPGTVHRMENRRNRHLVYLEVSTTFPDDIVRIEDDFGREGTTDA